MKLDFMTCWNNAMAILAGHKEAILAIAGFFIFLPTLLVAQFAGQPDLAGVTDTEALLAAYSAYFNQHGTAIIISNLLILYGGLAVYFAVAPSRSATVADNLGTSLKAFIFYFIANILTGLATFAGLLLLILPGIYIGCRLILVPLVFADQGERNPIEALKKSWAITTGNGLAIFLYMLIIGLVALITMGVVQAVIGLLTNLATGGVGWPLLNNIVAALVGTAFSILISVVVAGIYQQLTGRAEPDVQDVFN